jgi:hypothetical protein
MLKKIILVSWIFLIFACVPVQGKLVAWYKLDGNAQDSSASGFNGTEQNGPLTYVQGVHGKAAQFNGTNQFIVTQATAANLGIDGAKPKTICAWVNNGSASNTGAVWDVSSTSNRVGQGQTFSLRGNNTVNSWMVQLWSMDENPTGMVDTVGTWTHIAFAYDGTTLTVYSDGKQVFSGAKALALGTENAFRLGQFYDPGGTTYYFNGLIDDVRVYDTALNVTEVMTAMAGTPEGAATDPKPDNGDKDVLYDNPVMSWMPGVFADTHNVFFGTDFNDVNNAALDSHPNVTAGLGLAKDTTNYNPGILELETTYYWRVDEVNAPPNTDVIYKGTVWSFKTEDIAMKVPASDIVATAKNSAPNNDPNNVINELGLDPNTDQHSTTNGNWQSGTANGTDNPLWIRFDFKRTYKLHQMFVWNMNSKPFAKYGFQKVRIEYLQDNDEWAVLTEETTFEKAPGASDYVHNTTVDFNGVAAKAVRLTMLINCDIKDTSKTGALSEIRFTYIPTYARLPQPDQGVNNISVDSILSWRKGREALSHSVYIDTDENAVADGTATANSVSASSYTPALNLGRVYYWRVDEINNTMTPSKWSGDVWSFSTEEYISIEDFEDYNNFVGSLIFATWIGGDNDSTLGGSQVGHTDAPFAEETIYQSGKQSGPIYYNNSATAAYSEAVRTFDTAQNWARNGADTLRLYYRGQTGPFTVSGDSIVMSGCGSDLYTTTEQHRFAYKTLTGDGSITVCINGMGGGGTYPKAGIMIRSGFEEGAPLASLFREQYGAGAGYFRNRTAQDGSLANTSSLNAANAAMPLWLRLTRSGTKITAETSDDGITWVPFSDSGTVATSAEITMASQVCIGLFISANSTTIPAGAVFSEVATTGKITGNWSVVDIGDEQVFEPGNTLDTLYVSLTDNSNKTAKVKAPELAVFSLSWIEWRISYDDFAGIDMTKIRKITIGIGDTANPLKGKGLIYIDNIGYGHTLD